jgi:hypothetical protein
MKRPLVVAGFCVLSFAAGVSWAQQQSQPTRREPQFENDHVRTWKSIIMPKQPLTQHRHEHGRALIALTDGQLKVVDKDGKVVNTYNWERGKAYWLDADPPGQTHADVNETATPIEVIVVELKRDVVK